MTESQKHMTERLAGFKHKADIEAAEKCGYTLQSYRRMLGNMIHDGLARIVQERHFKEVVFLVDQ